MIHSLQCAEYSLRFLGFIAALGCLAGFAVTSLLCGFTNRSLRRENEQLHSRNSQLLAHRDQLRDKLYAATVGPTLPALDATRLATPRRVSSTEGVE